MTTTSTAAIATPRSFIAVKARIIAALLLSCLLGACGFLQLSYNNAPDLIYYWLDGYIGFDDAQKPRVLADVAQLQRWHRAEELPRYAALLEQLARDAPDDLSVDTVCAVQRDVQTRFEVLLAHAQAPIGALALEVTPAQLRHIEGKFAKQNAAFRKKWIDAQPAEQIKTRMERAIEQAERLYGRLNEPQLVVLRANLDRSAFDPQASLAEMQRRQRATVAALRKISGQAVTPSEQQTIVQGWLEQMQRSIDPAQRARQDAMRQQSCSDIAALHNSTDTQQRAHAAARLGDYARDFRELGDAR